METTNFDPYADINAFHTKFLLNVEMPSDGTLPPELYSFRVKFLLEETTELLVSHQKNNILEYLDALVDLDYVLLGTLWFLGSHGRKAPDYLQTQLASIYDRASVSGANGVPALPSARDLLTTVRAFTEHLTRVLPQYAPSVMHGEGHGFHHVIWKHAATLNLPMKEAWIEVQRANMSKIRAARPSDSKRGSAFDVVKPPGWTAPDHRPAINAIVDRFAA